MINPATQHFMGARMGARVRSEHVDHTPMAKTLRPVIEIFLAAVRA